jgi:hypothetical protein
MCGVEAMRVGFLYFTKLCSKGVQGTGEEQAESVNTPQVLCARLVLLSVCRLIAIDGQVTLMLDSLRPFRPCGLEQARVDETRQPRS